MDWLMRQKRVLVVALLAAALSGAPEAAADFLGGDNFNDNIKDTTRWGPDVVGGGAGALNETNSRLEYTTSLVSGGVNNAVRPWILNQGAYNLSWFVQMDAFIGFTSPATGVFHGGNISLGVDNHADSGDSANLQFADVNGQRVVRIGVFRDGFTQLFLDTPAANSSLVTLRIAFDAVGQTLTFLFDGDGPAGGLALSPITSISIGSGSANWGMDASSLFDARIFGAAGEVVITSGQLFADNFVAESVPEPGTLALLGCAISLIALRRRRAPRV